MRFSVIRMIVNVLVVFMILVYPVIGQAGDCGTSFNTFQPPQTLSPQTLLPPKQVCSSKGTSDAQIKAFLLLKGALFNQCTDPCSGQCNNNKQTCLVTAINSINANKITSSTVKTLMTCVPMGKCSDGTTNYDCSITFFSIECDCNCCPPIKSNQRLKICKIGEDCDICDGNLVDLDEFTATPKNDGIFLSWITKTELDSQGFRVWRGTPNLEKYCGCSDNIDDYKQITITTLDEEGKPTLIPATGNKTTGSNYSYLDKDVKPGIPYCYALEDVDSNGESKFYFEYITFTPDAQLEQGTQ